MFQKLLLVDSRIHFQWQNNAKRSFPVRKCSLAQKVSVLSGHSILAVKTSLFFSLEVRQDFKDTVSREEHETIYSGLRISETALSNQSE
jgi:hypothetical protein